MHMAAPVRSMILAEIAAAIGADAAAALALSLGGQRVYIPRVLRADHPVTIAIGAEAGQQLASYFHGIDLCIPIREAREAKVRALDARVPRPSTGAIAQEVGITERAVQKILARPSSGLPYAPRPIDDRQIDMFDITRA
jgi:hypothetical protein